MVVNERISPLAARDVRIGLQTFSQPTASWSEVVPAASAGPFARVRHSRRAPHTHLSAGAFAFGAINGVSANRAPSDIEMSSKFLANFRSRSPTSTRTSMPSSASFQLRFRACWVTQAEVGSVVQTAANTRRVFRCTKKRT